MWIAQLPLDCNGDIKFCPAGGKVGPSIFDVEWPQYWQKGELFQHYRSLTWNNNCINLNNQSNCKRFFQCLGGCKYSNGGPYQLDLLYSSTQSVIMQSNTL